MDIESIRLLIRVVEIGSLQRAAQQMGIPRSSLRRRLENLEASVGAELFLRSASGVALTTAGTVVLQEGRAILEHAERMVASAKSTRIAPSGRLRIVVPVGLPDAGSVATLRALHAITRGLSIEQVECPQPLDHLHEPFDFMIHMGDPPTHGQWFSRVLLRARLMPIASEEYFARHGRPQSVAELATHSLLSWRGGTPNPREWPLLSGGVVAVEPMFSSYDGQLVHRVAQQGIGILLGNPDASILPLPNRLVPVLEQEIGCDVTLRCLTPVPSDVDPAMRAVLVGIQDFISRMAPWPA